MDIEVVTTSGAPKSYGPYSPAVKAGGFVFISGQGGFEPATGQLVAGGIREQTRQVILNIKALVEAAGTSMNQVVKVCVWLHDWHDFAAMNEVFAEFFTDSPPARSTVQGERWPPGSLVAMEAIAVIED